MRLSLFARITELCVTDSRMQSVTPVTIGTLPDDVLLEIFSFYVHKRDKHNWYEPDKDRRWHTLVHVCRRWRTVVFASPRRLDLRLLCTEKSPVREMLDIWPVLPISIRSFNYNLSFAVRGADNIIAALKHNDRVCQISLCSLLGSQLEKYAGAMHQSFPVLVDLAIDRLYLTELIIPDSFLCGATPSLRSLHLSGIAFPALPKLLLSATDLVALRLSRIPHSGYIPPEVMATCLSVLTRLEVLALGLNSPQSLPDPINRRPYISIRAVLPTLTELSFQGVSEYLEDLVSRIDVPSLAYIDVFFGDQRIFRPTQLIRFLSRTEKLSAYNRANLSVFPLSTDIIFFPESGPGDYPRVVLKKSRGELSSLAQLCSSFSSPLSALESLSLKINISRSSNSQDDPARWLELLHPFVAVKNLYLDPGAVPRVAPALQELIGERVSEVLPALQNIVIKFHQPKQPMPVSEAIEQFAAARRLSGHPVAVRLEEEESASISCMLFSFTPSFFVTLVGSTTAVI